MYSLKTLAQPFNCIIRLESRGGRPSKSDSTHRDAFSVNQANLARTESLVVIPPSCMSSRAFANTVKDLKSIYGEDS